MTTVKNTDGMAFTGKENYRGKVTVRFTSDNLGETLSLQYGGVMILVPYEPVKKIIEETRKGAGKL